MILLKRNTGWLLAVLMVTALSLGLVFAPWDDAQAQTSLSDFDPSRLWEERLNLAQPGGPNLPAVPARPLAQIPGGNQVFEGDLIVEGGQRLEGSWAVYNGDAVVHGGGTVDGDLVVYAGDIEIRGGGAVNGNVTAFSGDIKIAGFVGGSVANMRGDIELEGGARVEGDVSTVSGDIQRSEGASVGGELVEGPSLRFPDAFGAVPGPLRPAAPVIVERPSSFFGWIGGLFLRLIGAALLTALVALLVGVLAYTRPETVSNLRSTMRENLALSFVVGLLANLTLLFLGGLLAATICLMPVALVAILALLGINLLGWSAVSQVAGERISSFSKQPVNPAVAVVAGAILLTGALAFLWALGGCFRLLAFLGFLGLGSFGAGAVIVPWLNRQRGAGEPGRPAASGVPPTTPGGGPAPSAAAGSAGPRGRPADEATGTTVDTDVAEPSDYVTAQDIIASQEAAEEGRQPTMRTAPEQEPAQPPTPQLAQERVELDPDAPMDYVTAQEVIVSQETGAPAISDEVSFTVIKGIGPALDRRLKEAGIHTFDQLAETSPEAIASILGWSVERVERSDIAGQARHFSRQG